MKWLSTILLAIVILPMVHQKAFGSETYYIDNQRVLLYKIINWWYDCLPEESTQLCGSRIKSENRGNARIRYNASKKVLTIGVNGGFAELLSIFNPCDGCDGPLHFQCTWLNRKYFGKWQAMGFNKALPGQQAFTIHRVERDRARFLRTMEAHIVVVVEGVIGGLMNGKIALHQTGDLLKTCPKKDTAGDDPLPIALTLVNAKTNEKLATYTAVYEQVGERQLPNGTP